MHLKEIEIQGFKTFVDRVKLKIGPGITVIVGPNGSGKSNVADAILWVLGEQSAKALRGSRMDDVIFSGSEKRRPVGMAEVTLHLDNSDNTLPLDFQDIAITRRFFRTGEGEYFINKIPCRLKDIQELFLDTGSGRNGLAIISQGRIEQILSARPEERRTVIEEAASISRYRLRKKEATLRLEKVEQDLLRLKDLAYDLKGQLGPAALEAAKAKRYHKLNNLLKLVDLSIKAKEYKETISKREECQRQWQKLNDKVNELKSLEKVLIENNIKLQQKQEEIQGEEQRYLAKLQDYKEQLMKTQAKHNLVQEKISTIKRQQQEDRNWEQRLKKERDNIDFVLNEIKGKQDKIKQEKLNLQHSLELGQRDLQQIRVKNQELQTKIENLKSDLFQAIHERTKCQNELVRIEEKQSSIERVQEHKRNQFEELKNEHKRLNTIIKEGQEQIVKLEEKIKTFSEQKIGVEKDIVLKEKELADLEKQLVNISEKRRIIMARLKVLRQAQLDYEGFSQGVKLILQAKKDKEPACSDVLGVVIEKIIVPDQLAKAVEVALGAAAQQILVRTDSEAERVIEYIKSKRRGRVTVLPLSWLEPRQWPTWANWALQEKGVLGIASNLVKSEEEVRIAVEYLLGHILIVNHIQCALALGKRLRPPVRIVTLDGEVIQPRGPVTGGVNKKQAGFLQRRIDIKNNETKLADLIHDLQTTQGQYKEKKEELEANRKQLRQIEEEIFTNKSKLHNLVHRVNEYKEQLIQLEERISVLDEELNQSNDNSKMLIAEQKKKQELLTQWREKESKLNQELTDYQKYLTESQQKLSANQQELAVIEVRLQSLLNEYEQLKVRENELTKQQENWEQQYSELTDRIASRITRENELKVTKEKLIMEEKILEEACKQITEKLEHKKKEGLLWKEQKKNLEQDLTNLQSEKQKVVEKLRKKEISLARFDAVLTNIRSDLEERYGIKWREKLDIKPRYFIEKRANRIRQQIKERLFGMTEVNPAAITSYERLKSRYEELEQQIKDLEEGRLGLEKVIVEMEKLMARKFKDTLVEVKKHFSSIFHELFNGGEASLKLINSEDILESGLEIIARPPGKNPQNLALLSGGEKALTAIAFIFALLKVKPSAFCIFDEVDTALDEANVERFARLLRKFAEQGQFIVISHRQGTMAAADILYGVTMVDQGISQLVSVRLDQLPA
ncbi:MAG: chromosome segregation protein [Clostridia bacterium]|nr:chromosome segregation protein [Clostridia bacterium]